MKAAHDLSCQAHQHHSEHGAVPIVGRRLNSIDLAAEEKGELGRIGECDFIANRLQHRRGL